MEFHLFFLWVIEPTELADFSVDNILVQQYPLAKCQKMHISFDK